MKIQKVYCVSWKDGTYHVLSGMTPYGWQLESNHANVTDFMDFVAGLIRRGYALVNMPKTQPTITNH